MTPTAPILLVEPDDESCALFTEVLQVWGYEVAVARSATEALAAVRLRWPRLALVELLLPDGDGHELVGQLRAAAEGRDLTVYAVTALAGGEKNRRAYHAGCDLLLTKPVNLTNLRAFMAAAVSRIPTQRTGSGQAGR